jgi:threonine/homoserine/homoserine lactone efflux protein
MVGLEIGWFSLVAVLISQRRVKNVFASVSHWVERATGATLVVLGLRLALAND